MSGPQDTQHDQLADHATQDDSTAAPQSLPETEAAAPEAADLEVAEIAAEVAAIELSPRAAAAAADNAC